MVSRTLALLKRVPLIKFRHGGGLNSHAAPAGVAKTAAPIKAATNQASAQVPKKSKKPKKPTAPAIEDWQLPPRYWRKPIDPTEMAYINNGGVP